MTNNKSINRRDFLRNVSFLTGAGLMSGLDFSYGKSLAPSQIKLGFVTYLWGKDWDIPTIIKNCTTAKIEGVELRVEHAHGVDINLSTARRAEIKKQFADTPIKIVGMGTNQQYDYVEQDKLRESIEKTKEFIKLSHDIGGSGVKVKPNAFHKEVPHEKTIEQIGKALNEIGLFAADYGQKLRLEVHGNETQELPNIKAMMDIATHRSVSVCWNCNEQDLIGGGLEYNFNLVKNRIGDITHVRELNIGPYPYQDLMKLFVKMNYKGWILLECRTDPADKVTALIEQRKIFDKMLLQAQS